MIPIRSLARLARQLRGRSAVLGLALAALGCENSNEPEGGATATSLEFVVNDAAAARAEAGTALEVTPGVRAKDASGKPVKGVTVTFSTNSGEIVGATRVTGDDGIARPFGWNLGSESGTRTLTATAGSVRATYTLRVRSQPAARIVGVAGLTQAGITGGATPVPPTVRVVDVFNNPVPGVAVTFTVTSGNGSVSPATVTTDSSGIATTTWTLGMTTGTNTIRATIANLASAAPVDFTASATVPSGSMQIVAGNGQSAPALGIVPVAPAVRVVDDAGLPQAGVSVTFRVLSGNGAVGDGRVNTDANGVAQVGGWALGPGGTNSLQAFVTTAPALSVTFTATTSTTAPFAITYRYVVDSTNTSGPLPPTRRQLEAFVNSNRRWARAITGDLANESMRVNANVCGNHPAVNESVDDVLIFVELVEIDGPGAVLGSAGPCFIRSNGLPVLGRIRLDLADLDRLVTNGTIDDVVTHEIGHVLGVGSIWNLCINSSNQFTTSDTNCATVIFRLRTGTGTDNPEFIGDGAKAGYAALGAAGNVPVENTGGQGTRDSHWRETTFFNELMTGFVQSGRANPMSQVTVGSLSDMGYAASNAGVEPYALPTSAVMAEAARVLGAGTAMNDLVETPRFVIRRNQRVEPVLGGPTPGTRLRPDR